MSYLNSECSSSVMMPTGATSTVVAISSPSPPPESSGGSNNIPLFIGMNVHASNIYVEDRFETQTVLKPSNGFKSVWTVLKRSRRF